MFYKHCVPTALIGNHALLKAQQCSSTNERILLKKITTRFAQAFLLFAFTLSALSAPTAPAFRVTPAIRTMLNRISADSLRGHLSFIASDALEGRGTPSRGLDIAAEYIAAQFRRAGLEPVGDDGYFQTANWLVADRNMADFEFHLKAGSQEISVAGN